MRRMLLTLTALGVASFAWAQETTGEFEPDDSIVTDPPASEDYDPQQDIVTDESRKPSLSIGENRRDSPLNTEYGAQDSGANAGDPALVKSEGQSKAKASELKGRTVVTLAGDEVGQIREIGTSPSHEERIATIDVGGFLGVGEKTIAVPLSRLHWTESDGEQVRISMMRTELESEAAFDESSMKAEK